MKKGRSSYEKLKQNSNKGISWRSWSGNEIVLRLDMSIARKNCIISGYSMNAMRGSKLSRYL